MGRYTSVGAGERLQQKGRRGTTGGAGTGYREETAAVSIGKKKKIFACGEE